MKYTLEIEINLPLNRTIALFDDPDNLSKWQPGLISFEHLSGDPGQPGAKSKLIYKMGKREITMIETVAVRNLPQEFSGSYEAKGVFNKIKNEFVAKNDNTTIWKTENEFTFSGFMKIMGFFMKGAFPKQTMEFMNHFKNFAEDQE